MKKRIIIVIAAMVILCGVFDRNRHPYVCSETGEKIRTEVRKSRTGIADQTGRKTEKSETGDSGNTRK